MVLGLQIPVAIKMRIIEEFLKDGNRYLFHFIGWILKVKKNQGKLTNFFTAMCLEKSCTSRSNKIEAKKSLIVQM